MPEIPSIEERRSFHDEGNERSLQGAFEVIEPEIRARRAKVLELADGLGLDHADVLEVGGGTGRLTGELLNDGHVLAIDLSLRAIGIARARRVHDAKFVAADVLAFELPERSSDLVVCVETRSCIAEQRRFPARMCAVLRDDGHLALTAMNRFVHDCRREISPPRRAHADLAWTGGSRCSGGDGG